MTKILCAMGVAMVSTALLAQSPAPVRLTSAESVFAGGGEAPYEAVGGDFNNDTHPDIVALIGKSAALILGNGDGTFQPPSYIWSTGINPITLVAGDFNSNNKDGNLDVAILSTPSNPGVVSILLGDGSGGFTPGATYNVGNVGNGWQGNSMAAGDLRHNGKLDLVVANGGDTTVSVLLGNGDGTFQNPVTYPASNGGPSLTLAAVAVGDFNGDGKPDLVLTSIYCCEDTIIVLLGNGDGTFQAPVIYPANGAYSAPNAVAVADVNGDKKLDVVLATNQGATVLLGNGDGTFQPPVNYAVGPSGNGISPVSVAIRDLNHDGKLDLVLSDTSSSAVWIFLGNGNGTFQYAQGYAVQSWPSSIVLADFNQDGNPDFASASAGYACCDVTVALGNGDGTFQAGTRYGYRTPGLNGDAGGFVSADFNNDRNLDLALAENDGTVAVFPGNSHGTFPATPIITTIGNAAVVRGWDPGWCCNAGGSPFAASGMQAADMNGDGKLDLVASVSFGRGTGPGNSGTNIAVMLGNGNGTFAPAAFYDVGDTSGIVAPVVGDFNGDGKPDVGVGNSDGTVSILLNQGNGVLGTAVVYANGEAGGPPIVADFNGDGKLDILTTGCGTNGINVLPGNGDGTFGSPITSGGYVCGPSVIAADFNNDGKLDLAVGGPTGTQSAGDLTILLGNGDGTFTPAGNPFTIVPICSPNNVGGPWNMAAADLNMDGNLDLIVAQSPSIACGDNLGVIVYTGNGDGTFSQNVTGAPFLVGDNPTGVLVGDFNKDGMPDVAVFNAVGFEAGNAVNTFVTVLLNRTLPVSASPASLNYYTQLLGTSSKAQTVVLTNDTSSPYSLSGLAVTGTDSADFKLVNHCSTSLKAGLKCSLNVTFDPAVSGTRTAAVTGAGSATVSLTGIATQVKLSPAKLNFGSVTVGQSSTPQTVTVTNVGASSLNFTGTRIKVVGVDAGDFSETNNCGASLGAGLSCTITVTFKPTATGTRGADVRITDNGGASPQYVRLGGTGT